MAANGDIIWLNDPIGIVWVFVVALIAMFAFAAFMQGYFADKCNWAERIFLLLLALAMFRPALITNQIGLEREIIQGIGLALWAAMYFYQKRRKQKRDGDGDSPVVAAA